jgi:DivIVA domain-containing protein
VPEPLSPEEVAGHTFPRVRRGYSDAAVRAFLARVSEQLRAARAREEEMVRRVEELESAPADPASLSREQLVEALGAEADSVLEQRARQAQARMADARTRAEQEVRAELETARARGREMLVEAQSARDRVLAECDAQRKELEARRDRLQAEITLLEQGRDRLLDVYRRVRQAVGVVDSIEAESAAEAAPEPRPATTVEPASAEAQPPEPLPEAPEVPASADDGVHELFTRLESEVARPRRRPRKAAPVPPESLPAPTVAAGPDPTPPTGPAPAAGDDLVADAGASTEEEPAEPVDPAIAQRDQALAPIAASLARQAKLAVQDEQNELLDALRQRRASTDPLAVVPSLDEHAASWGNVLRPGLDRAYESGYVSAAPAKAPDSHLPEGAPVAVVTELTHAVVIPLRERIIDAIRAAPDADALGTRVATRYREWRGQYLEPALEEALAVAYARGVYDGAPDGSKLRWVPNRVGQCPDADDNALEPTRRGGRFPTGQQYPPAHPGCRCVLAVLDEDASRAKARATTA